MLLPCVLFALLVLASPSFAENTPNITQVGDSFAASFASASSSITTKYTIQKGEFRLFNTSYCEVQGYCWFLNPDSPYSYVTIPPSPGEPVHKTNPNIHEDVYGGAAAWRLRADEAVVVVGRTPPRSKYFGVTGYVSWQHHPWWLGGWRSIMGSVDDSVNHVRVAERSSSPSGGFNQDIAVILTASAETEQVARDELIKAGFKDEQVFAIKISAGDPRIGLKTCLEDKCDLYTLVFRVAYPDDKLDLTAYQRGPQSPFRVWRLTPEVESKDGVFTGVGLIPRSHPGEVSIEVDPAFQHKFKLLAGLVTKRARSVGLRTSRLAIPGFSPFRYVGVDFGGDCYRKGLPCFGDNRDCLYSLPFGVTTLGSTNSSSLITIGVNHNQTRTAAYSSITVYNLLGQVGLVAVEDEHFLGSARPWLAGTALEADADLFYVIRWARDCSVENWPVAGALCVEVPQTGYPSLKRWDLTTFIERAYVNANGVGPAPGSVVSPRVIAVY